MTRNHAVARHAAARRRVATLARDNLKLRQDIRELLALKIRPSDNTAELMATVAKIARKHIPHS